MEEAYRDDLAYIHDAGYGGFARSAGALLLGELRRTVGRGLVIDLGCGSGILSEALSAGGFDVLGIDLSPSMIALARKRVPAGVFQVGSVLSAELPPCVAIAAIGEVLNYLFDDAHNPEAVRQVLGRAFASLIPGGLLLFDIAGPGRVPEPGPKRLWAEGDDWAALVHIEEDRQQQLLTRHITSFRKVGELYRRDHEVHRQRLLPRDVVATWLREIGFEAQMLDGYGPVPFPPGDVGFLARK